MSKFMAIGPVGAGKSTLCRQLLQLAPLDKKTQSVELLGTRCLDTPGEYLEHRSFYRALAVMAVEVDFVLLLQSPLDKRLVFPQGLSCMFSQPMLGVVTKIDAAEPSQIAWAEQQLLRAGVREVFCVSSITGEGIDALHRILQ